MRPPVRHAGGMPVSPAYRGVRASRAPARRLVAGPRAWVLSSGFSLQVASSSIFGRAPVATASAWPKLKDHELDMLSPTRTRRRPKGGVTLEEAPHRTGGSRFRDCFRHRFDGIGCADRQSRLPRVPLWRADRARKLRFRLDRRVGEKRQQHRCRRFSHFYRERSLAVAGGQRRATATNEARSSFTPRFDGCLCARVRTDRSPEPDRKRGYEGDRLLVAESS